MALFAFALQVAFVFLVFPRLAGPLILEIDPDHFGQLAWNWAAGAGFTLDDHPYPILHRGPGYPLLLVALLRVSGPYFTTVAPLFHAALGSLTAVTTLFIARRLFHNVNWSLLAALAAAAHPLFFWYAPRLRYEPLLTLLLTLLVYLTIRVDERPSWRFILPIGLLSGYAALTSQTLLLWLLVLPFFLAPRHGSRRALALFAIALFTATAVILPWTWRNYQTFGEFVPVHSGGISHFVKGSFEAEHYAIAPLAAGSLNRLSDRATAWLLGIDAAEFDLRSPGLDRRLLPYLLTDLRTRPDRLLTKIVTQFPRFWHLSETPLKSRVLGAVQALYLVPAIAGAVAWRRSRGGQLLILTILYLNFVHAFTRVEVRFSAPITSLLAILTVAGLHLLWSRRQGVPLAAQAALTAVLTLTAVACAAPPTPTVTAGQAPPASVSLPALERPRLFFSAADIPALQARAAATHADIWQPIDEYTASLAGVPPPPQPPPNGDLDVFRTAGNSLIPLAFACVVTDDLARCQTARNHLLAFAGWSQWDENNWRSLGHAHLLMGTAVAYDWLHSRLTPSERSSVASALGTRAEQLFEASRGPKNESWNNWWFRSYLQNHYSTINSALGIASLALAGDDPRSDTWLNHAADRLWHSQVVLDGISDGSWHESIHYHNYTLTLLLPFLTNVRALAGVDLLPKTFLRNYPVWRLYNYLPDDTNPALSYGNYELDWGNAYRPQNILRFIAAEYGDGRAEWVAQRLIEADGRHDNVYSAPWYVFEFLYYDPAVAPLAPDGLPLARYFSDIEAVIWRDGWTADDLVITFKGGPYGGRFAFDSFVDAAAPWEAPCSDSGCQLNIGHDHDDALNFTLYRSGDWLIPERVGYNIDEAPFHNTILVDGLGQYQPPSKSWRDPDAFRDTDSSLVAAIHGRDVHYAAADASPAFTHIVGVQEVVRHLVYLRHNYLLIVDALTATTPHQYTWITHFESPPATTGGWFRSQTGDNIVGVYPVAPATTTVQGDDGRPYIRLQTAPTAATRLVNLIYPTDAAGWSARPTGALAVDTPDGAVVTLTFPDGRADDIILLDYAPVETADIGRYQLDARAAVVGHEPGGLPRLLFLSGGTTLVDADHNTVLLSNPDGGVFEAHFDGDHLTVDADVDTPVTIFAPATQTLTLNGALWSFTRQGDHITFGIQTGYVPVMLGNSTGWIFAGATPW